MTELKETLTPEEEIRRDQVREEYMKIGWSTEPSDRPSAEEAMTALYKRLGKAPPKFVWFDSPRAAVETVYESTGKWVNLSGVDGSIDSYWVAFYKFAAGLVPGACKEEDLDHLAEWDKLVRSTGPCWPYTNYCLMSERPCVANYNDSEVLHCDDGPALEYRDGFKIFAIEGVAVPEVVVMRPWDMTLDFIEGINSADVQAVAIRRWCYEEIDGAGNRVGSNGGRWLTETGAVQIHEDMYTAYEDVVLMRALLRDRDGRQFLLCTDSSTDRVYHLRVSPYAKTCSEAHASINGGIDDSKIAASS